MVTVGPEGGDTRLAVTQLLAGCAGRRMSQWRHGAGVRKQLLSKPLP